MQHPSRTPANETLHRSTSLRSRTVWQMEMRDFVIAIDSEVNSDWRAVKCLIFVGINVL